MQLLFSYPTIEIKCQHHVGKILTHYLKQNNNEVLNRNHFYGALLKGLLEPFNPDWDYSKLCHHYQSKLSISISESEMNRYGGGLSPSSTQFFNNTVDKAFEHSLFSDVRYLRAEGYNEEDAIYGGLAMNGLTVDDYSYNAAHSAVYRFSQSYKDEKLIKFLGGKK
jgi:hypothetical protein